jgi:membrane protease YdiL (CAAX protease family)
MSFIEALTTRASRYNFWAGRSPSALAKILWRMGPEGDLRCAAANDVEKQNEMRTADVKIDDKTLAAWEIVSVISSVLIVSWTIVPLAGESRLVGAVPIALAFALMIQSHRARGESLRDLGFRADNFFRAIRLLILPMAIGALLLLFAGRIAQALGFGASERMRSAWWILLGGFAWGLLQQYALQGFIHRRLYIIYGRGARTTFLVALIFAGLHAPNFALMAATFASGLVWAFVYERAPNLWALGLSHSTMSWIVIATLPDSIITGLRVGYKYFM